MKINYFDREYIEFFFFIIIVILFLSIISNIYRNIYRAFKVFYFISTKLNYKERRKLVNIFTLILELYNVTFEYIVKVFFKSIKKLNRDFSLEINDKINKNYIYTITLTNDIFQ